MINQAAAPKELEVWKNVTKGMRWYTRFDARGLESDARVLGGRTFTLTPFERQINQEKAASGELDLFRNGTFLLVRGAESTNEEEIRSPASLSNDEIEEIVQRVMAEPDELDEILEGMTSAVVLDRLVEFMVGYGVEEDLIEKTRDAFHRVDGSRKPVRRRAVGGPVETAPEPEVSHA